MNQEKLIPHGGPDNREFVPDGWWIHKLADSIVTEIESTGGKKIVRNGLIIDYKSDAYSAAIRIHLVEKESGSRITSYSLDIGDNSIVLGEFSSEESDYLPLNGSTSLTAQKLNVLLGYEEARETRLYSQSASYLGAIDPYHALVC